MVAVLLVSVLFESISLSSVEFVEFLLMSVCVWLCVCVQYRDTRAPHTTHTQNKHTTHKHTNTQTHTPPPVEPDSGAAQLTAMALDVQNELGILSEVVCPKHTTEEGGGPESSFVSSSTAVVFEELSSAVEFVELSAVRCAVISLCDSLRAAQTCVAPVERTELQHANPQFKCNNNTITVLKLWF